jgi:outer membrane protein OmpA-like peptidoglycan-associated protein
LRPALAGFIAFGKKVFEAVVRNSPLASKISLVLSLGSALLLAACETPNSAPSPPRTVQTAAQRPAPMPSRAAPTPAPRRLPGIRPFTREADLGNEEESALLRELRSTGLDAAHDGISIVLILGDDILFSSGSSQLNPKARDLLKAMASVLKRHASTHIDVEGYTDTAGAAAFNLRLSEQRAKAVADILLGEGVAAPRISTRGFGENFPRVPTRDGVNEPRNRRVEITLAPTGEG